MVDGFYILIFLAKKEITQMEVKGTNPRALYRKFGFVEAGLTEEFGYPNQVFVLKGTPMKIECKNAK